VIIGKLRGGWPPQVGFLKITESAEADVGIVTQEASGDTNLADRATADSELIVP
jgi:hypothetical protein